MAETAIKKSKAPEVLARLPLIDEASIGSASMGPTVREIALGFLGQDCQFNSVKTGPGYTSVRGLPDSAEGTKITIRADHQPERVFSLKAATLTPVTAGADSAELVPYLNAVAAFQNKRVEQIEKAGVKA